MLENDGYREDLRDLTKSCIKVTKPQFRKIRTRVKKFYKKWMTDSDVISCINKRQDGKKDPFPEGEDIIRLSEAIANKKKTNNVTYLITGDGHFICYNKMIEDELDIRIVNYYNLLKKKAVK